MLPLLHGTEAILFCVGLVKSLFLWALVLQDLGSSSLPFSRASWCASPTYQLSRRWKMQSQATTHLCQTNRLCLRSVPGLADHRALEQHAWRLELLGFSKSFEMHDAFEDGGG